MTEYLIYFNQQWVGDHTEEWFRGRGPLAMAVVDEMKAAGVYVFAGGLEEEDGPVYSADATSGTLVITDGPYVETKEFLGGFAVVDVADDEAAKMWAGKIAEACGWPHEVRRFKPQRSGRVTPSSSSVQSSDRGQRCPRHSSHVVNPAGGSSTGSVPSSSPGVGMLMLAAHSASSSSDMGQVVCGASAWRRSSRRRCSAGGSSK